MKAFQRRAVHSIVCITLHFKFSTEGAGPTLTDFVAGRKVAIYDYWSLDHRGVYFNCTPKISVFRFTYDSLINISKATALKL